MRVFLCKAGKNNGRITGVDENNIANIKELKEPFRKVEGASNAILQGTKPYTCVISSFDRAEALGGRITVESDSPLIFKQLPDEGNGYIKKVF